MITRWTAELAEQARRQGWTLADVDGNGVYEIQKLDEDGRFQSDNEARLYVQYRAQHDYEAAIVASLIVAWSKGACMEYDDLTPETLRMTQDEKREVQRALEFYAISMAAIADMRHTNVAERTLFMERATIAERVLRRLDK